MYIYSRDSARIEELLGSTAAGGTVVNNCLIHLANPNLPFGGVGASGFGAYHGEAGFDRFSHRRGVLTKATRPDPGVTYPPYKRWKEAIIRRVL